MYVCMFVCERRHVNVVNLGVGNVAICIFSVSHLKLMKTCVSECRGCWVWRM